MYTMAINFRARDLLPCLSFTQNEKQSEDWQQRSRRRKRPTSFAVRGFDGAQARLESLRAFQDLSSRRQRSFTRLLVTTTERRLGQVDKVLEAMSSEKMKKESDHRSASVAMSHRGRRRYLEEWWLRTALRIGAVQLLFLDASCTFLLWRFWHGVTDPMLWRRRRRQSRSTSFASKTLSFLRRGGASEASSELVGPSLMLLQRLSLLRKVALLLGRFPQQDGPQAALYFGPRTAAHGRRYRTSGLRAVASRHGDRLVYLRLGSERSVQAGILNTSAVVAALSTAATPRLSDLELRGLTLSTAEQVQEIAVVIVAHRHSAAPPSAGIRCPGATGSSSSSEDDNADDDAIPRRPLVSAGNLRAKNSRKSREFLHQSP